MEDLKHVHAEISAVWCSQLGWQGRAKGWRAMQYRQHNSIVSYSHVRQVPWGATFPLAFSCIILRNSSVKTVCTLLCGGFCGFVEIIFILKSCCLMCVNNEIHLDPFSHMHGNQPLISILLSEFM